MGALKSFNYNSALLNKYQNRKKETGCGVDIAFSLMSCRLSANFSRGLETVSRWRI